MYVLKINLSPPPPPYQEKLGEEEPIIEEQHKGYGRSLGSGQLVQPPQRLPGTESPPRGSYQDLPTTVRPHPEGHPRRASPTWTSGKSASPGPLSASEVDGLREILLRLHHWSPAIVPVTHKKIMNWS